MPAPRVRRIFMLGSTEIRDPNPALTPQEVKAHLAQTRPELTNASVTLEKTEEENGVKKEIYRLKTVTGTRG